MGDKDGKTEKPTAKRLRDSRKRGEVAKSIDVVSAVALLVYAVLFVQLCEFAINHFAPYFVNYLTMLSDPSKAMDNLNKILIQGLLMMLIMAAPFMVIAIFIGIAGNFIQVGLLFTTDPLKPDFKRLNPINGFKQLFSLSALQNFAKSLMKLAIVGYLCYQEYVKAIPELTKLDGVGTGKILQFTLDTCKNLGTKIGVCLVIISVFDYAFQRYTYTKNLKMTKQEVKDEVKQMEGDPQVKAQRKQKHQEIVRNAVSKVKDATVVLANPTHLAIAIQYDAAGAGVPQVLAKGADDVAMRMKEEARKQNVPIIENKPLARALYPKVNPGDFIPAEFYEAIAEVIALVYKLEREAKGKI
ncbi:flagellar biosynthetic protein FlhB [Ligilactobacillus sp. WC1T17]|uniref:Flagellar biosynthetic protein FlhB n=1 Tax=Ligilactobacillus ruminis TaxID=1623 RepID=A0ABY1AB15_9LACO|nr:flagellar biosynthetic protein FlhB [Ligilactobacillus ruminis]